MPEHELLPTQEQQAVGEQLLEGGAGANEMMMASSAASETVETHRCYYKRFSSSKLRGYVLISFKNLKKNIQRAQQ